jgi:ADP-ribose pyrophosphatase
MALIASQRQYTGRIVNLDLDTVRFPDGSTGQLEMVRHPGASAVVPLLDDPAAPDPRVLLIRQFRHAAEGFIWEVPAGRLDPGETPEDCARRELEEETGMRAGSWRLIARFYTAPGFASELMYLYFATDLRPADGERLGPDEDEHLLLERMPWRDALAAAERGELHDGKTLIALLWLARLRGQ